MKTKILILSFAFALMSHAQNKLEIDINGLKSNSGKVMVALLDETGSSVDQKMASPDKMSCQVSFGDLKSGTYAVRYFHDENENGELDTGIFGIPKEGYGFSNNARGMMGPPDLEEMLFRVDGNSSMKLTTVN